MQVQFLYVTVCVYVLPEGRIDREYNTSITFACYCVVGAPWQWQPESSQRTSLETLEWIFTGLRPLATGPGSRSSFLFAVFVRSRHKFQFTLALWSAFGFRLLPFGFAAPFGLFRQRWAAQKFYWKSLMNDKLASASTHSYSNRHAPTEPELICEMMLHLNLCRKSL